MAKTQELLDVAIQAISDMTGRSVEAVASALGEAVAECEATKHFAAPVIYLEDYVRQVH